MKLTVATQHEYFVLLALGKQSEAKFGCLLYLTGLHRKTLNATLKRLLNKQLINKKTEGKKRGGKYSLTTPGKLKWFEINPSLLKKKQLNDAAMIMNLDMALDGKIFRWKCPIHNRESLSYSYSKDTRIVTAHCDESKCSFSNSWAIDHYNFEPDPKPTG